MKNLHAEALGKLARGIKKTMSPAALAARRAAALVSARKRRKTNTQKTRKEHVKKRVKPKLTSENGSV